ncbi:MAG: hypothetical protein KDD55_01270, partial [Bdellovibrionales bacterium]|nr:hypothetical protein [Bdellovibrionales bacterium]
MAQSSHAAKKIVPDESLNNYTYLTDSQVFICELSTGILGKLKVDAEGQRIFKSISKKKKKKKFRAQMKALRSELTRVSRGSSSYAKAKRKLRRKRQKKKEFLALYERCEKAADEDPAPGQDPSFVAFDITVTGTGVSPVTVQLEIVDEAPETNHSCIVDNYPDTVSVETVADCRILISPRIYLTEPVSISYHALRSDNESTRSNEATLTVTWQQQPRGDSERLAVKEIVRLSHPAYAMNNTFYGANNPLNVNETRMLMYELTNPKGDLEGGRLFVWGHIAGQGCESDAPCLTNWETKEEYEQAAKQVPALNNDFSKNRWMKLYWSPLETEENILYGLPRTANSIYRINVDTNIIEEVVSFDPQDGTDLSNPGCYGFTAWNSLWCSYVDEDWSKGGFEVDIVNRNVRFHNSGDIGTGNNLALHYCQEHPGENLPAEYFGYPTWFSHGHGAL